MYCVDFAETFRLGDMALFACHDDQQLGSFINTIQMAQYMNCQLEVTVMTRATFFGCLGFQLLADSSIMTSTYGFCPAGQTANAAHHVWFNLTSYMYAYSAHSCGSSSGLPPQEFPSFSMLHAENLRRAWHATANSYRISSYGKF